MMHPKPTKQAKRRRETVRPEDAEFVLRRDGECIIAKLARWGWLVPHRPCPDGVAGRPTIEHVREHAAMGKVRVHATRWMVRACAFHNVEGETSRQRRLIRDYLSLIHGGSIERDTPSGYGAGPEGRVP